MSFSQGYGSILRTSLTCFILWTRGCSPWRPEAVMGTIRSANFSVLRLLSRAVGTGCFTNRSTLSPSSLISRKKAVKHKKTTLPEVPTCNAEFLCASVHYPRHIEPVPFRDTRPKSLRVRNTPVFWDLESTSKISDCNPVVAQSVRAKQYWELTMHRWRPVSFPKGQVVACEAHDHFDRATQQPIAHIRVLERRQCE